MYLWFFDFVAPVLDSHNKSVHTRVLMGVYN